MKHINQLRVLFSGEPVGLLELRNKRYWFQYDAHWLQQGFNLAPQVMDFNSTPQLAKLPVFQGLHGIFYDSLPDGWGLLLMDRFFKRQFGWDNHEITPLDRLAYLGKRAMGALEYEPVIIDNAINESINLQQLVEDSERVLAGKSHAVLNQLRILGGSPGGARPKVTVALANHSDDCVAGITELPQDYRHWIIKFRGQSDSNDMGKIEKIYAELAVQAGLEVPSNRLIQIKGHKDPYFAVQRFDRVDNTKQHMLTLSGYLYADFRLPSLDYNALLTATAILTKDMREVERAFRLMVYNVAMHNKDDHAKNFAFICNRKGQWRLAPAYDLTFSTGMNNQHTTAINGAGNPTRNDFAAIAAAHHIHDWENIIDEVLTAVAQWKNIAKKYKVTKTSFEKVSKALVKIRKNLQTTK